MPVNIMTRFGLSSEYVPVVVAVVVDVSARCAWPCGAFGVVALCDASLDTGSACCFFARVRDAFAADAAAVDDAVAVVAVAVAAGDVVNFDAES